jgi:Ca2+-transporting ATPase
LVYLLAVHIPIAGMSVIPVLLNLPLVLLPMHIAFLHLIIEPACSVAFEAEPGRADAMLQPPRKPNEPLFSKALFVPSLIQGTSILFTLLFIYVISLSRGQGDKDARALTFTSLIISNLVLIFTSRGSATSMKARLSPSKNSTFLWITLGALTILGLVLYVPTLRELFRFSTLH